MFDKLIGEAEPFVQIRDQLSRLQNPKPPYSSVVKREQERSSRLVRFTTSARRGASRSLPSTVRRCPTACSKTSSSVTNVVTDAHAPRPGLLAQAHRGTIFLDAVESLTLRAQGALLRVLHDRTFRTLGSSVEQSVDVRFVAATNIDLAGLVNRGAFRADLYYRLRVRWLELPPLRDRRSDISLLSGHFLAKHAPRRGQAPVRAQ